MSCNNTAALNRNEKGEKGKREGDKAFPLQTSGLCAMNDLYTFLAQNCCLGEK